MLILAIETSCDETAAAVIENGRTVRSSVISSQIEKHARYGGVIPELAAREHILNINWVVEQAIQDAGIEQNQLDAVAVTSHPGLMPALAVGVSFAKGLAATLNIPVIGINHFLGHIYGAFLETPDLLTQSDTFPIISLVVSGGHTALVLVNEDGTTQLLGQTIDDAAGEAYDKAAKLLNLGYPGGPILDRLAKEGDKTLYKFPRALCGEGGKAVKDDLLYHFSFSGVKTSLLYKVKEIAHAKPGTPTELPIEKEADYLSDDEIKDLVASYQEAIVDVLIRKVSLAIRNFGAKTAVICGGVACNSRLREVFQQSMDQLKVHPVIAPAKYCTDNAAMIGGLAWHYAKHDLTASMDLDIKSRIGVLPNLPIYKGTQA